MKRIGILTAGGDTPALNATIHGAVERANAARVEAIGLIAGFSGLLQPNAPHVHLNPLFATIPELDPCYGGSLLGSSREYLRPDDTKTLDAIGDRLTRLRIEGLICVGGDGTFNGLQPLCERIPTVLAPKTIDNDLGLNYPGEAESFVRVVNDRGDVVGVRCPSDAPAFNPALMVNYATPGFATAVYVATTGVERIRTTAESHRRIAIVEVMGRRSGFIALGAAYGQPDIVLVPESPVDVQRVAERAKEIYELQQNVVILCGEGIVDESGCELGALRRTTDPAGNVQFSGAADTLAALLFERIGADYFRGRRPGESPTEAVFTRKIGHTQRGGRPLLFDRFYAAQLGGKAVEMLLERENNRLATLQWDSEQGFFVSSFDGQRLRDRWGQIHARRLHSDLYDPVNMRPSAVGIEYLLPIFTDAIGSDDVEAIRRSVFDSGNLFRRYHSKNTDVRKRWRFLEPE